MTSKLYSFPPKAVGDTQIESLTSYITRLATEHCLKPGDLIADVIAPVIGKCYITRGSRRSGDPFYSHSYQINGLGQMARDFIYTLMELTGIESLESSTMVPYSILPPKGILKTYQAWCPKCYQEWAQKGKPLFNPLIWYIRPVLVCGLHQSILEEMCPKCSSKIPHLSKAGFIGYCPKCGQWLGNHAMNSETFSFSEFDYWVYKQAGLMLEKLQKKDVQLSAEMSAPAIKCRKVAI